MEDWKQLAEYVKSGSESAFESVVQQHLQMVYATAMRKTGNRDTAEEVAQSTFIVLAEKANKLKPSGSLGAWLHRTALLKSKERIKKDMLQAERLKKLQETGMPNHDSKDALATILPLLDDAVDTLQEDDRQLLLLRFFQKRSLRDVGSIIGIGEDAARKRVRRTVDKLRRWFDKRGVSISSASLVICLEQTSAYAMPATLAAGVLSAVQSASTISATTSTLIPIIGIMKLKTATLIGLGIVTCCGILLVQQLNQNKSETNNEAKLPERNAVSVIEPSAETPKPAILEQVEQLNASTNLSEETQTLRDQFLELLTADETARFEKDPAEAFLRNIPVEERGPLWELVKNALDDPELHVRVRAMHLLPLMWPQHKEALPWIEEKLRDGTIQSGKWMNETFHALSQIMTEPQEYARIVKALLNSSEETKHTAALQAPIMMAKFKDKASEIQSLLSPYLQDENPSNRLLVAEIMAQTGGPISSEAIDVLSNSLEPDRDFEDENQRLLMNILWKLGPDAKDAVPALLNLADANPEWGEMVDVLLKTIHPEDLKGHAIQTPLPPMTPEAQTLIDHLQSSPNTLKDIIANIEKNQISQTDVLALASLQDKANAAAPALTSALKTMIGSNPQRAFEVGAALERIQPDLPKPLLTAMDLMPVFKEMSMPTSGEGTNPALENSFREWTQNLMQSTQGMVLRDEMLTHVESLKRIHPDLHQQWLEGLVKQDAKWNEFLSNAQSTIK